jgi:hypothetical protein
MKEASNCQQSRRKKQDNNRSNRNNRMMKTTQDMRLIHQKMRKMRIKMMSNVKCKKTTKKKIQVKTSTGSLGSL